MEQHRFAGYRVIEFPEASKTALKELAERLIPHEEKIIDGWINLQFHTWQPPNLSRNQLHALLGGLLRDLLMCMRTGDLELCISNLEESGASLAQSGFPYEALIVSLHFLEESYMPFLLTPRSERTQEWLIRMDEFLHVGIAALATSYFEFHRQQLLAEAEVGRVVMEALFPHIPRKIGNLELGFVYSSASEHSRLGGDFLDVFNCGDKAVFVVGDLSGHGLEAAAGSAALRSTFRGFVRDNVDLADAMRRLNRVMTEELEGNQFATALAGLYEAPGHLTLVNAGAPPPILCGGKCFQAEHTDLPLTVISTTKYHAFSAELEPGDVFVAFTDGLMESRKGTDLFGEDRVMETAYQMRDASPRAIAEELKDRAVRHGGGKLLDDIAILVIKRKF